MVVQGGLIGPLVNRFGELRLTLAGLGLLTVGCLMVPMATEQTSMPVIYSAVALLALGTGLVTPCLRALISKRLTRDGQGAALGGLQGLQSLGTFLGASAVGLSYDRLGQTSPFWIGAVVLFGVAVLVAGSPLPESPQRQI